MKYLLYGVTVSLVLTLVGCATPARTLDDTAFRESKPQTILILPPLNLSVEPAASAAVLAQATYPLAESGYYVVPVGVMEETFKQNGLTTPEDIHELPGVKLREIFGADTALYMTVNQYGSSYRIVDSKSAVEIEAVLVDLRNGAELWRGSKLVVESTNTRNGIGNGGLGLISMLVRAVVDQVVNSTTDRSYSLAEQANNQLLSAGGSHGFLYGPYSPHYATQ